MQTRSDSFLCIHGSFTSELLCVSFTQISTFPRHSPTHRGCLGRLQGTNPLVELFRRFEGGNLRNKA